jgi:hypothetical protein
MKLIEYSIDGLGKYEDTTGTRIFRVLNGDSIHLDVLVKQDSVVVVEGLRPSYYPYSLKTLIYHLKRLGYKNLEQENVVVRKYNLIKIK